MTHANLNRQLTRVFVVGLLWLAVGTSRALAADEPTAEVKALIEVLKSGGWDEKKEAADKLKELGPAARPAAEMLAKLVGLPRLTPREALNTTEGLLLPVADPARVAAMKALYKIDKAKLKPALEQALKEAPSQKVKLWAKKVLENLANEE